ncbi:MAG TPA: PDZ domain-containing protein [Gemmatimonadaceae bacterium]|nr:PDZ domain-containing protein [Gemmatimonadaceae bacterium]
MSAIVPIVAAASVVASGIGAQQPRVVRVRPGVPAPPMLMAFDQPRAVIGVTTTSDAESRDTLGVLVTSVRAGSPAEKAGIEEGNRIQSVNGVSLRLSAADVGDREMAGIMARRLTRELDKLAPGDNVDLRVYADGHAKSVTVKTQDPEELYRPAAMRRLDDRATLGLNLAVTGSPRDSIGVFVLSVDENGPAAKAGIQEGSRIAAINGVDLREHGASKDADDDVFMLRRSNVNRLEREVANLKPGDDATLRVFYNGQYRDVKVKSARMSDLPRARRTMMIMGDDFMPPMPGMAMSIDAPEIQSRVRRALDEASITSGMALRDVGRAFARIGGNRVEW